MKINDDEDDRPRLVFPGGGIFFFWQAGAVTRLRDLGYGVSRATVSGASAGALTATMTAAGVDFVDATERAIEIGRDVGLWRRPTGLFGIWGSLIVRWLDDVLPDDAVDHANERVSLLLTPFPSIFEKERVTRFEDKSDLIRCNLASMHLPYFLDGCLASTYKNNRYIDGSFLSKPSDHFPGYVERSLMVFDFQHDPMFAGRKKEFVSLFAEDAIRALFERGFDYASILEQSGQLEHIHRLV